MAKVALTQLDEHAPWQEGEIVTVQVLQAKGGAYICETLETYPPDLKQRHADELEQMQTLHAQAFAEMTQRHQEELARAQGRPEMNQRAPAQEAGS